MIVLLAIRYLTPITCHILYRVPALCQYKLSELIPIARSVAFIVDGIGPPLAVFVSNRDKKCVFYALAHDLALARYELLMIEMRWGHDPAAHRINLGEVCE